MLQALSCEFGHCPTSVRSEETRLPTSSTQKWSTNHLDAQTHELQANTDTPKDPHTIQSCAVHSEHMMQEKKGTFVLRM